MPGGPPRTCYALVSSEGIVDCEIAKCDGSLGKKYGIKRTTVGAARRRNGYVKVGIGLIAVPVPADGLTNQRALEIFRGQKPASRTTDQCIGILRTWWEENGRKPYTTIPQHLNLTQWASGIRSRRDAGKLNPDVRQQLDDIGFPWEVCATCIRGKSKAEMWDEKYNELVAFKEEHGHVNVPNKANALYLWLRRQNDRACNMPGTAPLSESQRSRLVDIGVEFTVRVEVAGVTVGMFAAETAGLAKSKAEDTYNGFDESTRNMSGEAMVYRILLELAKDDIVRTGDRLFRHTSGGAEVVIPTPLPPPLAASGRAASGEKTAVKVCFKGVYLHVGRLLHPMKVEETSILARHEALLHDVHGVDSKGEMSKEDFYSLLKSRGLYHRADYGLPEEVRTAVKKYIFGAVSSGSGISHGKKVIEAILAHTSMGSDLKVRTKIVNLIRYFKAHKLEKVDGVYRYIDEEGTVVSAMSMSRIEIDIEMELLNLSKDDETVSSIEDDGRTIDTDCCSVYSKPAKAKTTDDDDRKPAAKRTADEAFAGDVDGFTGNVAQV